MSRGIVQTVWRVLVRYDMNRLVWFDPPTGERIRYERPTAGDLLHVDVKKLGRIPDGGGWKVNGRAARNQSTRVGYAFIHTAIDDHSRVAYSEILSDEKAVTATGFVMRAVGWFDEHGVTVREVMTDNGSCYRSHLFCDSVTAAGIKPIKTRLYRPQTNGKVERFHRTLATEWAYASVWRSDTQRTDSYPNWLHQYNHHRTHTAIGYILFKN